MGLITKIAWRNIQRHKGKSLVIGSILFLGAFVMTIGNGVISGMDRGLQRNIVEGFTGDVVIVSDKQESDNVFLEMMGKAIEPINNYTAIKPVLQKLDYVDRFLPAGKNAVMFLSEQASNPSFTLPIGVDFEQYQKVFPNCLKPIEGRLLRPGERGVLVTTGARKEFYNFSGVWCIPESCTVNYANMDKDARADSVGLTIKDNLVFMGMGSDNATTDVRVGVKGIVRYRALELIFGHFSIIDIESFRECLGYVSAAERAVEVPQETKDLLSADESSLDAMFGSDAISTGVSSAEKTAPMPAAAPATEGQPASPKKVDVDAGAYNVIMTFFKDDVNLDKGLKRLNQDLKDAKTGARAVTWKKAFGAIGSMAVLIKAALFLFVMFLFFVAIIIIVNTLSMAALERTNEIGMMRAVGARKGFITAMFSGETAMLSFVFGGMGIVAGFLVIAAIPLFHITTDNDMLQLLYGGESFTPLLSAMDIGLAIAQLTLVTLVAMVYPAYVARSITPLDAISRD
jgi:putative ABC transport system permease protein